MRIPSRFPSTSCAVRRRANSSRGRSLERRARSALYAALAPIWRGTRAALRRAIRTTLKSWRARPNSLARLVRDAGFAAAAGAILLAGVTRAEPASLGPPGEVRLAEVEAGQGGFVVNGRWTYFRQGSSVSPMGDINGDGAADILVGGPGASLDNMVSAGATFVVFGKTDGESVEVMQLAEGDGGFLIKGAFPQDQSGRYSTSAGDVNGDGLEDMVIGCPSASPGGLVSSGYTFVVFGKADTETIDLREIHEGSSPHGFVINGAHPSDRSGFGVSGAGDVNGDGLDDVVVAARYANPHGFRFAGQSYVVFGKADTGPVSLLDVSAGVGGFVINGTASATYSGWPVSAAGDVNGDGFPDILVAARWLPPNVLAGVVYVVFGDPNATVIELSEIASGAGGFLIQGNSGSDLFGRSLAAGGDINGDGLADLIIGASTEGPGGDPRAGRAYVVFGKSDGNPVLASAILSGAGGFAINGIDAHDRSGSAVESAGDMNGDGLNDLVIGAPEADPNGLYAGGEGYVVFGKPGGDAIELINVAFGSGGFLLSGAAVRDRACSSVAPAGDVNGDGRGDLVLGAPFANTNTGKAYIVFGTADLSPSATYHKKTLAGDGPSGFVVPATNFGDVARAKIDFSDDDFGAGGGLNGASSEAATIFRDGGAIANLPEHANVMWRIESDRAGFASARVTLKYIDAEIAHLLGGEYGLAIFQAPAPDGPWTRLESTPRPGRNEIAAETAALGYFAIADAANSVAEWRSFE